MKSILIIIFLVYIFGGLFWLFSIKAQIFKSHGRAVPNEEIRKLAAMGDPLAQKLVIRYKIALVLGVIIAILMIAFQ